MKKKVIFFDNTEHFNLKQIKIKKREKEKSVLIQNYKRVCVCECVCVLSAFIIISIFFINIIAD